MNMTVFKNRFLRPILVSVAGSIFIAAGMAADVERRTGTLMNAQVEDLLGKHDEVELSKYQRLVKQAEHALEKGEHTKAFERLNEARLLEPSAPEAYVMYARLHLAREEYASAEKAAKLAVKVAPEDAAAWYQHSKVQSLKGENDIAIQAAREAVKYRVGPRWDYQKWLGDLLFEGGKAAEAADRFAQSAATLEDSLQKLDLGIQLEESKREVVGMHEETELVAGLGGTVREVPVTRLEKQYKEAPEEWYEMKRVFTEQLGEVYFSRFEALIESGKEEEARGLMADIFQKEASYRGSAHYSFALRDYESVLAALEAAHGFWAEATELELATYVISLASGSHETRLDRSSKKLKRAIRELNSRLVLALLDYLKEYAPELNNLPSRSVDLTDVDQAIFEFYKAQFHFAQGYEELAWPILKAARSSGLLRGFELKVATVQLELRK